MAGWRGTGDPQLPPPWHSSAEPCWAPLLPSMCSSLPSLPPQIGHGSAGGGGAQGWCKLLWAACVPAGRLLHPHWSMAVWRLEQASCRALDGVLVLCTFHSIYDGTVPIRSVPARYRWLAGGTGSGFACFVCWMAPGVVWLCSALRVVPGPDGSGGVSPGVSLSLSLSRRQVPVFVCVACWLGGARVGGVGWGHVVWGLVAPPGSHRAAWLVCMLAHAWCWEAPAWLYGSLGLCKPCLVGGSRRHESVWGVAPLAGPPAPHAGPPRAVLVDAQM